MKHTLIYFILTFGVATILVCRSVESKVTTLSTEQTKTRIDTVGTDTTALKETFNADDIQVNDYLTDRLNPIRTNFKRINSTVEWTSTDKKDLWETTEGGEAIYYYQNGQLEKISARYFGETHQQLTEYYLLNGQLSFVFEKSYEYNRPIYYDTTAMKENNDNEAFDFDKSKIIEDRSYFEEAILIHQLNNQDDGSPYADDYLQQEQKRIVANFEKLISLGTKQ